MQNILEYVDSFDTTFLCSEPESLTTLSLNAQTEQLLNVQESSVTKKLIEAVFPEEDLYRAAMSSGPTCFTYRMDWIMDRVRESTSKEVFNEQCVRCTLVLINSFPSYDREETIDLSHPSLLGYNFGVKLNSIISGE